MARLNDPHHGCSGNRAPFVRSGRFRQPDRRLLAYFASKDAGCTGLRGFREGDGPGNARVECLELAALLRGAQAAREAIAIRSGLTSGPV